MDRFAANTLRTFGIVLISIFVVGVSGLVLLLALCLGVLGNSGTQSDRQTFLLFILGGIVLIAGGIFAIAKLAKGIARGTPEYQLPVSMTLAATTQACTAGSTEVAAPPVPASPYPPPQSEPHATVDSAHLRPASRDALRNLALAISAKLAAELLVTLYGSIWIYRVSHAPFAAFRFAFIAWGIAAVAPLIVLLYALLRHPGPRALAYSLVIPGLQLFFGIFGHSAAIFVLLRATPGIGPIFPMLSLLPWLFDILILYLAWKAIRITGIQPNSTRLIVASAVIFIYTSMLPTLLVIFNNVLHLR